MKVLHIESGLGNQMLDYCDFLAEKYMNPNDDFYIENMIYDISDAHATICMWNGYELDKVFGIQEKNIKELFNEEQWNAIIEKVRKSKFWEDNWTYSDAISEALNVYGLSLENIYRRPHLNEITGRTGAFGKTFIGYNIKRIIYKLFQKHIIKQQNLFIKNDNNAYTGHTLKFIYKNSGIEKIDKEIRQAFKFPEITDEYNLQMQKIILETNSIAIHARRGDMLSANGHYYKYGYFRRAIRFIKKKVKKPVFFFFCDPGSIDWVKNNPKVFGVNLEKDNIVFVTGNSGENSFRDMQLMSLCKHAVITNSSFGFWGAYLNMNPNKITCSPDVRINTTHSF